MFIEDEDGYEIEVPTRKEVCWRCNGYGVHDHPAFSNGITSSELLEDPDFHEEYIKGRYDVRCSECKGLRVIDVPDYDSMSPAFQKQVRDWFQGLADSYAESAAERRMGA